MNRSCRLLGLIAASALILFASCASAARPGGMAPVWVTNPPEADLTSMYFSGVGTSSEGDLAEAENAAVYSLIAEVTRFIGVRISAETTVEARDTLEAYEQEMVQIIRQESAAQIGDFTVEEKWISRTDGAVTVYLLGKYNRQALLAEKARMEAVFAEREAAVSRPEREGDMLMEERRFNAAALRYLEAAGAASRSGIDNAPIKFERNINKAMEAVRRITIVGVSAPQSTFVNEEFAEPFRFRVIGGTGPNAPPLEGVRLRVVHRKLLAGGRMGVESAVIRTGPDGYAEYFRGIPLFVGSDDLRVALSLGEAMEGLEEVSDELYIQVEALERLVREQSLKLSYTVVSRAKAIPTGILCIDVDRAGNPLDVSDCAAGILEILTEAGFAVRPIPADIPVNALSDREIIRQVAARYGAVIDRVIFGTARIDEFSESGENYIVKVNGTVKAADLDSGEVLYSSSAFKRSRAGTTRSAVSAAFKSLGREFGEELLSRLP